MLFGVLNALICKNTGLELNPALRDSSISHPFPLLCGFQETKKKAWRKATREEIAEVVKIATNCLFYICLNNILCGHGSDCLTSHV